MKKILSISALAFSLWLAACGGSEDIATSEAINSGDVPLSVLDAFNAKYPGAVDVTWGKRMRTGEVEYSAAFIKDGKEKHAEYREREGVVIQD